MPANGHIACACSVLAHAARHTTGTAPLYVNNTTLSARVGSLNPRWNQPSDDATLYTQVSKGWEDAW